MTFLFGVYVAGCLLLLVAGVVEQRNHHRRLRSIPQRIVVNGIRGKSSITRLCAGAMRGGGLRIVANGALSNTDFSASGLVRSDSSWESPGYAGAATKTDLTVNANAASLTLRRDGGCS